MAGNNLLMMGLAFIAGVVMSNTVRSLVQEHLNFDVPSLYASYPAEFDNYPSTSTRTSLAGNVYERDYDNANELNINHVPV